MYNSLPSFVLGFHGCDKAVGEKVLAGKDRLRFSKNSYDWLGNGLYFWENNPYRALEYAKMLKERPERVKSNIVKPFALGAIIDLGHCLNLLETNALQKVSEGYEILRETLEKAETPLPSNKSIENEDIFCFDI